MLLPGTRIPTAIGGLTVPSSASQQGTLGNGWEIRVLAHYDYNTVLAVLPRWTSVQFSKVLNDKGAGTVTIDEDDEVWTTLLGDGTTGNNLIDFENLFQVWQNGILVFDFLGESVTEALVDDSESRTVTITGPGTIACLGWACAMPPGFPNIVFKTDAINDGFAEQDPVTGAPDPDFALWNDSSPTNHITLSPLGTCQLTASPGTTFLGATPYDLTDSLVSVQIVPLPMTGLNGTQLTQFYLEDTANSSHYALFGLSAAQFYMRTGDGVGHTQTKTLGKYDPDGHAYWQISYQSGFFYFWTSADGSNWVLQWKVASNWTPKKVSLFISATYSVDNTQTVQVTNINGNVVTPTSAGNIYLKTPSLAVWKKLLVEAQSRSTINFVTTMLTETTDSFGNPWTDSVSQQIALGTNLYDLLQSMCGVVNADFIMQPGFVVQVGLPVALGSGVSLGRDLSHTVIMREGAQQKTKQRVRSRDTIANLIGAVNGDGTVVSATDAGSITSWGQREAWVQAATQVDAQSMAVVAAASVAETKDETLSWTLDILSDHIGSTPFVDFDCGDWIGMERPGIATAPSVVDALRVIGIAISIDSQSMVTAELTLNSYRQWLAEQLLYLMNKFGGQFLNSLGSTPITNGGGIAGMPIVVAPALGGLANVTIQ